MAASKLNRAFSLVEILVAVSVLSVSLVFICRSFLASLSAETVSRDLFAASLLAQEKMLEMEGLGVVGSSAGFEDIDGQRFEWRSEVAPAEMVGLNQLIFSVSWEVKPGTGRDVKFLTYLIQT